MFGRSPLTGNPSQCAFYWPDNFTCLGKSILALNKLIRLSAHVSC
jgi:hypothetical protein